MFSSGPIHVHSHVWALSLISCPHFVHYWSVQNPLRSHRVVPPKLESVCGFGLWSRALISIFLDWHQQLLCVLITMVTLLSGWWPLCCQRSTQANEAAIIMMFPSPPPLFACFFPLLTNRNKQPLQTKTDYIFTRPLFFYSFADTYTNAAALMGTRGPCFAESFHLLIKVLWRTCCQSL